jgi:hypothetical protein
VAGSLTQPGELSLEAKKVESSDLDVDAENCRVSFIYIFGDKDFDLTKLFHLGYPKVPREQECYANRTLDLRVCISQSHLNPKT